MQALIRTIQSGWPNEHRRCPMEVQDYWNIRGELSIICEASLKELSAIVINSDRTVIPRDQRHEILQHLHLGHFGVERTNQSARDAVYWPHLNTDIDTIIGGCSVFQEHQWATQKEPVMNHPIPARPF